MASVIEEAAVITTSHICEVSIIKNKIKMIKAIIMLLHSGTHKMLQG